MKNRILFTLKYDGYVSMLRMICVVVLAINAVLYQPNVFASGKPDTNRIAHTVEIADSLTMSDLPLSTWVGSGDVIRIKVFPDTSSFVSGSYVILDSGFVLLPLIGRTKVTHISVAGLTVQLTSAYAKYLAYPTLQIDPLIRVSLLGGFIRPGMYFVSPFHPLSSALSTAGGTVRDDGLKMLRWERGGKVLARNLIALAEGRSSLWALGFESGDQICVTSRPKIDELQVAGFVISSLVSTVTLVISLMLLSSSSQ